MTAEFGCGDARVLGDLLDDRLPPDRQAELADHLEACEVCRHVFDKLAAGSRWWGDLRRYAPGAAGGPAAADEDGLSFLDPPTGPGHLGRLGPYEVLGLLGRGGMGVVLKAFDPALHRLVAIKVLAPQLATGATARRRFAREARAVAAIAHDHIVAIHAVDEWDGLPFLVMPYVQGRSLQERINAEGPLGVAEVLRIGIQTASGLAAAHAQGVIHRDIKPSNILLENGVERVKITDFGLARAADDASLTQSGYLAGTPQYMAPEQARGEPVDPRADLFSLGSVLYTACTGRPPFRAETTMGVLRRVCEDDPRPIRDVNPDVPDWLAAIIGRLLAKDPADRFASAAAVAGLMEPFLAHVQHPSRFPLPPFPGPRPAAPRLRWAAALAAVLVLGGLGAAESTGMADVRSLLATVLRIRTRDATLVVEVEDPGVEVSVDEDEGLTITGAGAHVIRLRPGRHQVQATKDGKPVLDEVITITRGGKQVVRVRREPKEPGPGALSAAGRPPAPREPGTAMPAPSARPASTTSDLEDEPTHLVARTLVASRVSDDWPASIDALAFSSDGRVLATAGPGKAITLRDAATGEALKTLDGHADVVRGLAFSPDGGTLASASHDGTVKLWDVANGRERATLSGHANGVFAVAFAPDGKTLASAGSDKRVRLWDAATGEPRSTLEGHTAGVRAVAFAPDGRTLASGGADRAIRLWSVSSAEAGKVLKGHPGTIRTLAFAPDGTTLASGGEDATVRLWDMPAGELRATLQGHADMVTRLAFSPTGRTLASGGWEGAIRLWDVATGRGTAVFAGQMGEVSDLAFSPLGWRLAVAWGDGSVKVWEPATPELKPVASLDSPGGAVLSVAFSPDGKTLVWGGQWRDLLACTPPGTPSRLLETVGPTRAIAFAPDGSTYATAGDYEESAVKVWDARSHRPLLDLKGHGGRVLTLDYAPDGRTLASAGDDKRVRLWEVRTGKLLETLREQPGAIHEVRYFPDGRTLAIATGGGEERFRNAGWVMLWDLATRTTRAVLIGHRGAVRAVAVSADGTTVVTGGYDGLKIYDARTGELRREIDDSDTSTRTLAFSRDGRYLASGDERGDVSIWGTTTLRRVARLKGHTGPVYRVAFGPDGRTLATGGDDWTLKLWRLPIPRPVPVATFRGIMERVWGIDFAPDGKTIAVAWGDWNQPGGVTLWDIATGKPRAELTGHRSWVSSVAFAPDGSSVLSASEDKTVKVWDAASGRERLSIPAHPTVCRVAVSPRGDLFATAAEDRTAKLWGLRDGTLRATLTGHRARLFCVGFSPDGTLLATGSGGFEEEELDIPSDIIVWDVKRAAPRLTLSGHTRAVMAVAFSPDGKTLASAGCDNRARVWDLADGRERFHLDGTATSRRARSVAFSPDGARLAVSFLADPTVKIVDATTGVELAAFCGHDDGVCAVQFSPDGLTLATGSIDRTVKLWDVRRLVPTSPGR